MITFRQSNHLKSIAILMMLCLHLFNTLDYEGLFEPLLYIGSKPLIYYVSLFCDTCVPIFAFVSGYGLYFKYQQNQSSYWLDSLKRLKKLYVNYWIIILLFPVSLGLLLQKEEFPGSLMKIFSNLSGLVTSYNGAWWFFTIYVLFVLTSSLWFKLFSLINPYVYLWILIFIYIGCYYFRVYKPANHDNELLNKIQTIMILYGCTLFQFLIGAFALRLNWNAKISRFLVPVNNKNILFVISTMLLIVLHGAIPNFIIAPFMALLFLFLFTQLRLNEFFIKLFDFFSPHATNIWLVHMFFYMIFFKSFIYSAHYVVPIFLLLVFCCIGSSIVINKINNLMLQLVKIK